MFLNVCIHTQALIPQYHCNASIGRDAHRVSQFAINTISGSSFLRVKVHSHKSVCTEVEKSVSSACSFNRFIPKMSKTVNSGWDENTVFHKTAVPIQ